MGIFLLIIIVSLKLLLWYCMFTSFVIFASDECFIDNGVIRLEMKHL